MVNKCDLTTEFKRQIEASEKNYDLALIDRALAYADAAHAGQFRSSGEEYICHPIAVATIVVELGLDTQCVLAALLHDVVEDTPVTTEQLAGEYGEEVAQLVEGLTKLGKIPYSTREEQQAENVRKMLLAISKDIRVILIKFADRLHNMRTIAALPDQKQRDIAKETMDIYAPLAHRLGIRSIKEELEDRSLHILDPVAYQEIEEAIALRSEQRIPFLEGVQQDIKARLEESGLKPTITGRIKSRNSIYRKMYIQGRDIDEVYDIYALRVIVDEVNDCYNALGIIHEMFRPLPGRFKDYISTPKSNMYQSLHTTVIGREKVPFEVQIRTWDMHFTAEYGIAAHWKYKLGMQKRDRFEERIAWVRQFIESQKDADDAEDIVRAIKTDLSNDDTFVFTPRGDVITLPEGSTVIDFAYAIHTAIGNRMTGAKVDGRIVPLTYKVKTGQIVEVLTSPPPGRGPSRDWLNIVTTAEARSKIRTWFKKERREENIEQGRDLLDKALQRDAIRLTPEQYTELLEAEARRQHCNTLDDLYAAIGYGGLLVSRLLPRIRESYARMVKVAPTPEEIIQPVKTDRPKRKHKGGVIIAGEMGDCLVKFSRCCNPLPGDDIIGFITRGAGVSIHKRHCRNVPADPATSAEPARWVEASWEQNTTGEFKVTLTILCHNRESMLADILSQLVALHIPVHAVKAKDIDRDSCLIGTTIEVQSIEQLNGVLARLEKVPGVTSIRR
ncbi:MAG: bifunctional (p)ppGpp synthetase/guanosine-3',5'-bis(diphosphate) 3'-pyrophosphohydrolase [Clostridia bacterium]|nr:bifunctional (p)ppGpp synthetase/guanosine-3',5'-bis(diphosphate) 3'-pyrophosphohydrolase [Clostridia bacterium]